MAETWEIILWVIVAAAIVILIIVAIAIFLACRKRNRRKKNVKHRRFEWERKDETDYGKRKVRYDASSGEAKIIDEADGGGEKRSQVTKVEYNAKSEEAKILGVGDNKGFVEEKATGAKNSNDETSRVQKFNDYQMSGETSRPVSSNVSSEKYKSVSESSRETEVKRLSESKGDYVRLDAAPVQRERLQPIEVVPRETAMTTTTLSKSVTSQGAVKSYTNLGYSQTGQNGNLMSNVQFQQPVAVIKAFVNPGQSTSLRQAKSLPRNYSKLNYKKSFMTSTTPRRKPLLYTWSLKANDFETTQPWLNLPVVYRQSHPYAEHRRSAKHRSSTRSRSFTKRSLMKQKDRNCTTLNGIYIANSRPRRSYQHYGKSSTYYEKSMRPYESHFVSNTHRSGADYGPSKREEISKSDRRNYGDFYEEHYKTVKKSEFPAFRSSSTKYEAKSSRDIEPEISSIVSGSEFSDFLPTPPRPSESPSDGSAEGYSRGSYKAYKSRLEKSSNKRREEGSDDTSREDRAKHTKSFQETLESLRNGDRKEQYSVKHEVTASSDAASPWVNNERNFRKQHGVPLSGVPVLPPEPVFIQVEDSDRSDCGSRKRDDTD